MNVDPFGEALVPVAAGQKLGRVVTAPRLNALAEMARQGATGTNVRVGPGMTVRYGASGAVISLRKTLPRAPLPLQGYNWTPTKVDSTHLTISISSAAGGIPTIGGTSLAASTPPQLTVSASALQYIYLKVTWSPTINASGYVTGGSVTGRVITAETTTKTSTSTDRYFLLFTWQAGVLKSRVAFWNFEMNIRDDGTASSTPEYRTWVSA